ncbi:MAG: hypothetical protein GXY32_10390 [Ruminococcaceae bacterium]|nr:hypothetical protein [Oscillospiraceae bacterium]
MPLNKAQMDFIIAEHKDRIESELELSSHRCSALQRIQDAFEKTLQQYDGMMAGEDKMQLEKFYGLQNDLLAHKAYHAYCMGYEDGFKEAKTEEKTR